MKRIGYWKQREDSTEDLPWPVVGRQLSDDTKHKILLYLNRGKEYCAWKGCSTCRLCGCLNGTVCMTDGKHFIWPEGYAHYIDKHNIMVDTDLLAHVLTQ